MRSASSKQGSSGIPGGGARHLQHNCIISLPSDFERRLQRTRWARLTPISHAVHAAMSGMGSPYRCQRSRSNSSPAAALCAPLLPATAAAPSALCKTVHA